MYQVVLLNKMQRLQPEALLSRLIGKTTWSRS
jgi:hypothetical protein